MNVRSAMKFAAVVLFGVVVGCSDPTLNPPIDQNDDPTGDQTGQRSAPRMLYHNPAGELDLGLRAPARMDYTASTLYVADPVARAIVTFDRPAFAFIESFPLDEAPVGIAADGAGQFYVSLLGGHDSNGRVAVYDATFAAPLRELAGVSFVQPTDIAIDGAGNIYVVDSGADAVQVFDNTETYSYTIGERGSGEGQFKYPSSVAIDSENSRIVVADQENHRIQVFDDTGSFEYAFGYRTKYMSGGMTADTWMGRLAGVAVDDGGFIYVADSLMGSIQIYDQTGGSLGEVLGHEDEFGGLVNPADIAIDPAAGLVMVVNTGAGKVQLYDEEPAGDLRNVISTTFVGGNPEIGEEVMGWDAPHMLPDVSCRRCHDFDGQPEGHMGQAAGQANLCFSCHTSAGQAAEHMFLADGSESHPWGVGAVDDDHGSTGPSAGGPMADHLDNGDIKCTTCHDQHTDIQAEPFLRMAIWGGVLCGDCHVQKDQWDNAGHSDVDSRAFEYPTGPGREACARCHSGLGYIDFTNGVPEAERRTDKQVHSCVVCHGPHGVTGGELLRTYDNVTLPGGHEVTNAGSSATCMACHNGRYVLDLVGNFHTPHYLLGGVMFVGINGEDFGNSIPNSMHSVVAECASCHMADTPGAGDPGADKVGGHSWNMAVHDEEDPDFGFENYANSCGQCHVLGLTVFNRLADGDYDGDAAVEGVQDEVQGLLDLVLTEIENIGVVKLGGYPYWDFSGVDPADLDLAKQAVWNYQFVTNDHSLGVHNTRYAVSLLQVTYKQLTSGTDVPGAYLRYTADARRGGLLYDKWWKVNGATEPTGDHPLYPPIGQKSGSTTYRCKECHGWDYEGKDGAYAGGSHYTGIIGILGTTMTPTELFDILKNPDGDGTGGTTINGHNFGVYGLSDGDINDLVELITTELVDNAPFIDFATKAFQGDAGAGQSLYDGVTEPLANCSACHGADGKAIDFGGGTYIGTVANGNPWETFHKIRFGQPAKTMCSFVLLSLTDAQAADVGTYCQTLPTE